MEYTFKSIKFTDSEKIWLEAIYNNPQNLDIIDIKVALHDKLQKDFDYTKIDRRICRGNYLTLIGIWHVDNKNSVFDNITHIISYIKQLILNNSKTDQITAKEISSATGINEFDVENSLFLMSDLGRFNNGATRVRENNYGFVSISIREESVYDSYLNFSNIEDLMENFYTNTPYAMPLGNRTNLLSLPPFGVMSYGTIYPAEEIIKEEVKKNTAFIIMPMERENPDLEDILNTIKEVCGMFNIIGRRADEIEHQEKITDVILREIRTSEYLIADLSLERPNVYYEIGYAHANNKKPIMYRKEGVKLHFDLSVHNVPEYRNISDLKNKLIARLEAILGRTIKNT